MFFSLNESIIQKLIDFMAYYFHSAHKLSNDLVETKVNLRNLLVFLNSMVLKLANSNS